MKIDYSSLEKKIKISFKNKELLVKSLTHKSFDSQFSLFNLFKKSIKSYRFIPFPK